MNGINTSAQVGQMLKFDAEPFGGSTLALPSPIDIPAAGVFTMKVWSPRAVNVLFKLEGPVEAEVEVAHGGSGWEELRFDFPGFTGSVEGITLIFDLGTNGDAAGDPDNWTFYFDDITLPSGSGGGGGGGDPSGLVADFEADPTSYDFGVDGGFGGGAASVIANPQMNGINTSAQVGQMLKFAGEVFGGSTLALPSTLDVPIGSSFTMKVWSPRAVNVLFKLEGGPDAEVEIAHGGTGWEELSFDFSSIAGSFTGITFIFDLGTVGDAMGDPNNWTFYFDDITLVAPGGGGGGGTASPSTDFEGAGPFVFSDFGGGVATVIANPDASGINTSATVGQMQKFAGEVFGGSTLDLGGAVDFSAGEVYTMKVRSSRVVDVLFKLEGLNQERTVTHGGTGWELLCFDFTGATGGAPATAITLIFDNGTAGDAANDPDNWTFQFDDIEQAASCPTGGGGSAGLLADFEDDGGPWIFSDFAGGVATVEDNPDAIGINSSPKVGQMLKFAGEVFGGSTLALVTPVDVPANSVFTMKVWSQRAVPVLFKLEGGPVGEIETSHGGTGWEELSFDFGAIAGLGMTGITFIFDNGTSGAAATDPVNWTFYFDDITLTAPGGGGGGTTGDIDFEPAGQGAGFTWAVFENADNPALEFVANPAPDAVNGSATVAQFTARQAGATFAGTNTQDLPTFTLDATNSTVTIMVYKSVISDVGLKFEQGQASTGEILVANTLINQWEELTFDFSGKIGEPSSTDITGFVVFPDFDARTQDNIVYFDNITFSGTGGGGTASPLTDFEDAGGPYAFSDFGGGVATVIDNPESTGINPSAKVGQMEKFAGEVFGGSTLDFGGPVDFSAGEAYTMKVRSSRAVDVLFKLEGLNQERTATHGGSGWEELCFDFTGTTGGAPATALTLIFDLGVNGDAANDPANWTFQFDDVLQTASCGGGGGSGNITDAPVDFEPAGLGAGLTWAVFENSDNPALEFVANPAVDAVNGSATVAQFTARQSGAAFAGTNTQDLPTFTLDATNSTVKIMVYKSVISNVGLKFEQGAASTGEILVANTLVNQWEELTFDFSGKIGEPSSTDISGFVVFPDFDARTQDNIVYFDNITFGDGSGGGGGGSAAPLTDFEGAGPFAFSDFGGGVATVIANPDASGINTSAMVGQMQKFAGEVFGGSTLDLGGTVDFSAGEVYTMKVRSSRVVDVLFKLEGLNQERTVTHGGTGWEVLCFDFTGTTGGAPATAITLIFDNGTAGDAANDPDNWTFQFDDIEQAASCPGGGGGSAGVLADFEDAGGPYMFSDFAGGVATVEDNPDATGINVSPKVGQMLKFAGDVFGGSTLALTTPVDVPANSVFTMKVWSQRVVPVLFKLEGGPVGEISANHGGTGWEELSFDFGAISGTGMNAITLIFDLGVNGAAATDPVNWTFYFDDIAITDGGGGSGGGDITAAPVDFEPAGLGAGFTWAVFENVDNPPLAFVANPAADAMNGSATVAQFTARLLGQPFAGTNTQDLPTFTLDATNSTVKIMVYKTVISNVGLKFEQGAASTGEILVANTLVNQWEELTFDFSGKIGEPSSTDITGFVVFPDFDTRAQENVVYFDNITFSAQGSGGGTGTPSLITDFEDAGGPYTFSDFEGGAATVLDNPDATGINLSPKVGQMLKFAGQTFGGSTLTLASTVDVPAGSTFTMKVWSQRVVPVLFKLEGGPVGEIQVNHGGTGWEELSFDFTGISGTGVSGITLIFDNGTNGAAATDPTNWTFYFDDITIVTP